MNCDWSLSWVLSLEKLGFGVGCQGCGELGLELGLGLRL